MTPGKFPGKFRGREGGSSPVLAPLFSVHLGTSTPVRRLRGPQPQKPFFSSSVTVVESLRGTGWEQVGRPTANQAGVEPGL